eukprot:CCRYP_009942-RA/>CCRYP_009942-RA protein AED:0.78 eAED:0.89 QI:0/0/0/1/0/0/2/0/91
MIVTFRGRKTNEGCPGRFRAFWGIGSSCSCHGCSKVVLYIICLLTTAYYCTILVELSKRHKLAQDITPEQKVRQVKTTSRQAELKLRQREE